MEKVSTKAFSWLKAPTTSIAQVGAFRHPLLQNFKLREGSFSTQLMRHNEAGLVRKVIMELLGATAGHCTLGAGSNCALI